MNNKEQKRKSLYSLFFDICIVGGGAAGMAAAIAAKEKNPTLKVCILEKKEQLGKKILATGNGRCNITNAECEGIELVTEFLERCNIIIKEEAEGRMYPYSEQAASVVNLLALTVKDLGVASFLNCNVLGIEENDEGKFKLEIDCMNEEVFITCDKVLLACGGKAAPQFGTTGDGYKIAKYFGHTVSKVFPILMPVECDNLKKGLKGARAKSNVSLLRDEQILSQESGEVQFTEDGISGICVFNLTRYIELINDSDPEKAITFKNYEVEIDFMPEFEEEEVLDMLQERKGRMAKMSVEHFLHSLVNEKIARYIIDEVVSDKEARIRELTYDDIENITMHLKSFRCNLSGAKGWRDAQCTAGGVVLSEVENITMESKIKKNLYFAGEILDYDGPCGGYNLHHAWKTGMIAGESMASNKNESEIL